MNTTWGEHRQPSRFFPASTWAEGDVQTDDNHPQADDEPEEWEPMDSSDFEDLSEPGD